MSKADLEFANLIGSRICHDLISPIGAVNNGLELLSMTGVGSGPEMALIGQSVGNASARIRFFRIAFGAAGEQLVGQAEIRSILRDLYLEARWTITWVPHNPQSRLDVRLAFLALMCLETGMPYGGDIHIDHTAGNWTVKGTAEKLNIDETLWARLANQTPKEELRSAQVQFALLPAIAGDGGRQVTSRITETQIVVSF